MEQSFSTVGGTQSLGISMLPLCSVHIHRSLQFLLYHVSSGPQWNNPCLQLEALCQLVFQCYCYVQYIYIGQCCPLYHVSSGPQWNNPCLQLEALCQLVYSGHSAAILPLAKAAATLHKAWEVLCCSGFKWLLVLPCFVD